MPDAARLLQFPGPRKAPALSLVDPGEAAQAYLSAPLEQRPSPLSDLAVSNPDVLNAICVQLRKMWETAPRTVVEEAARLHASILESGRVLGVFDERDYFLGETALIAATAARFVGKLDEAERWLDRAEARFRHVINPAPLLANLSYARLTLRYTVGEYTDVLELLPSLVMSFHKLGMELEAAKCQFLEVKTLMQLGRVAECLPILAGLRESRSVRMNRTLLGHVLIHSGNCFGSMGQFVEASQAYAEALPVVGEQGVSSGLAELKFSIGDTYRVQGQFGKALDAYRAARADYAAMSMRTFVAHLHLIVGETLLSIGRHREAEWEILAALPIIDEQRLVPEGFAAVTLLKESIRRRKTDPNVLRELREYLQGKS